MHSMFRNSACVFLLTLACASTAHAFPPCPIDEAGIVPLDAPAPPGFAAAPWKLATVASIGNVQATSLPVPCSRIPNAPSSGDCRVDSFDLDDLPFADASGAHAGTPHYADAHQIGVIGLPDLRNAAVVEHAPVYALTLGINPTPLANVGDWIDIGELQMDSEDGSHRGTLLRLRKITRAAGSSELALIEFLPDGRHEVLIASIPLDTKKRVVSIALRWSPRVQQADRIYATDVLIEDGDTSRTAYSVDTTLTIAVDGNLAYRTTRKQQAPTTASIGLLDYNLSGNGLMATPPSGNLVIQPISPTPVMIDSASNETGFDSLDPLDQLQHDDVPGARLIYYYTTFSVVSK